MLPPDLALLFFGSSLALAAAPGPDNLFVLTQSALHGVRAGLVTTLGLVTGLCAHTAAVALGLAALLQASPHAFMVIKCLGAAYLLYLAHGAFRSGATRAGSGRAPFPGYAALYRKGVILNVTNPKVTLFFLALLPQFADPGRGSLAQQIVWLGLLFQTATLIVFGLVSLLGNELARRLHDSPRGQLLLNRLAGCLFVGLALMLLFTSWEDPARSSLAMDFCPVSR